MDQEHTIWTGSPSQYLNFKTYFLCTCTAVIVMFLSLNFQNHFTDQQGMDGSESLPSSVFVMIILGIVIPLIIALWQAWQLRATRYTLTNQRLISQVGLLSRRTDEIELYRVRDYHIEQPFIFRLLGIGTLVLETSDRTHPTVVLHAIHHPEQLRDHIRDHVEVRRNENGRVREIDFT